jgi:hypothetical protein
MQIIADETRIYIQNEEDYAIEATGMPYKFDNLVRLASKYERQHNKLPGKNIQTIFEASVHAEEQKKAGGFHQTNCSRGSPQPSHDQGSIS